MSTETATITGVKRDILAKTSEDFIDVEVTFTDDEGKTEVCKYAYPIDTTRKEIEQDIKRTLKARKQDRDEAVRQAEKAVETEEKTARQAKADKTVKALEGITVK